LLSKESESKKQRKKETQNPTKTLYNDIHDEFTRLFYHLASNKHALIVQAQHLQQTSFRRPLRPPRATSSLRKDSLFVSSLSSFALLFWFRDTRRALDTQASAAAAFIRFAQHKEH
jgi:hypothetical protein